MLTVHHLNNSRSQRIIWLLEELGVAYDIEFYSRDEKTQRAPESLRDIHPLGMAPVVTIDEKIIAESGAVIDFLVRNYANGRLSPPPNSAAYDDYIFWLHYAEGTAVSSLLTMMTLNALGEAANAAHSNMQREAKRQLAFIEQSLFEQDYILAHGFSAADVQLLFVLEFAKSLGVTDKYRAIEKYIARNQARPAYKRALERGGPYHLDF